MEFYSIFQAQEKDEAILSFCDDLESEDVFLHKVSINNVLKAKISMGSKLYDYNSFDDGINCIISQRFYELILRNNIKGCKTYKVEIEGINKLYYGLQIYGRCGKLKLPSKEGFYKGYDFDLNTWDKSDFFSPKHTCLRFINQKVKALIFENNLKNIHIENIREAEIYSFGK